MRRLPEPLQVVELARCLRKNVNDKIYIIEQHPIGLIVTFHLVGGNSFALEAQFHFIGDGLNLSGIFAAADYEVICECRGVLVHFEDADVLAFFFFAGLYGRCYLSSDLRTHSSGWILLRRASLLT